MESLKTHKKWRCEENVLPLAKHAIIQFFAVAPKIIGILRGYSWLLDSQGYKYEVTNNWSCAKPTWKTTWVYSAHTDYKVYSLRGTTFSKDQCWTIAGISCILESPNLLTTIRCHFHTNTYLYWHQTTNLGVILLVITYHYHLYR